MTNATEPRRSRDVRQRLPIAAALTGGCALALYVAAIPLSLSSGEPALRLVWPVPFLGMALIGALVAARRPQNATGWTLLGAGFVMVASSFCQAYARFALARDMDVPALQLVAWLAHWLWMPATVLVGITLVLFPTGRGRTKLWHVVVRFEIALLALIAIAAVPTFGASPRQLLDQLAVDGGAVLGALANGPISLVFPLGFLALITRLMRSRGVERQQMKWFVFGASLLAVATAVLFLVPGEDPIDHPLGFAAIGVGTTAIPVTAGVAILRHRLYDIDRIVSRAVSYAVVVAVLVGVYAGVVVGLGSLLRPLGSGNDLTVATSTLVVAAAFRPLSRRVRAVVDRRFNRARYDAARTIDAFTARLRDEVELETLSRHLVAVVDRTMQPRHSGLWLAEGDRG